MKTRYIFPKKTLTASRVIYWIYLLFFNAFNMLTLINFLYYGIYYDDYDNFQVCYDHLLFISNTLKENGYVTWGKKIYGALHTGHYEEIYGETRYVLNVLLKEPFIKELNLHNDIKMVLRFLHQHRWRFIRGLYGY